MPREGKKMPEHMKVGVRGAVGLTALLVVLTILAWMFWPSPLTEVIIQPIKLQISFNEEALELKSLTEEEKALGQLFLLEQRPGKAKMTISGYYEEGQVVSRAAKELKKSTRDAAFETVRHQLPVLFPNYGEISQRTFQLNGYAAGEIVFSYGNQTGTVRQRLLVLAKDDDSLVYIRAQASEKEFNQLNQDYFEPLLNSARFYEN